MTTCVALRHIHFEDLGYIEPLLRERGYDVRYVDAPVANLAAFDPLADDLMVVLGGPVGVYDDDTYPFLRAEIDLIRRRLAAGKPILGVCLGAQLIASALGAKVYALGVKEIGFGPLTLTDAGRASPLAAVGTAPVLHWHGDQFDIPEGMRHLASTPVGANQAFGDGKGVLGLQFHLEADLAQIERWLVGHASELAQAGIDPRTLRAQAADAAAVLPGACRAVVAAWLDEAYA
ncbi:GMP synthase (glutamine-hydrolysing) [Luteibacter sp. UNC138MFCol5.1]|uniref:glutamine amidotransferase n=1 Tax=Luteibacter sp. UNC138MFCol5.1 TaxID=1502774 RepID=UPI0008ADB648|nr:glutamine amidotransferase [Luteibacter sp. UNC138MFCol5.1]SEO77555.1 GMP synthase (glutamine-hydrolysing) [Luteibacter sp. UNC138MFCol5.1]